MSYSFPNLEPVCYIQIFQEAGNLVWYSHLLKNFPQFVVIHIGIGFGIVNKTDVFLQLSCFFYDPMDVGNLISGSSAFSKPSLNICKFSVHVLLKSSLKNFEYYFAKAMAPHSSTLAWKIPWTEEPGRLKSIALQRVGHD